MRYATVTTTTENVLDSLRRMHEAAMKDKAEAHSAEVRFFWHGNAAAYRASARFITLEHRIPVPGWAEE
jgi:hypothetical protein